MAKMKAAQVAKAGGGFEIVERNIPEPGRGEVRIFGGFREHFFE